MRGVRSVSLSQAPLGAFGKKKIHNQTPAPPFQATPAMRMSYTRRELTLYALRRCTLRSIRYTHYPPASLREDLSTRVRVLSRLYCICQTEFANSYDFAKSVPSLQTRTILQTRGGQTDFANSYDFANSLLLDNSCLIFGRFPKLTT